MLDFPFDGVVELVAVMPEKLDPVVLVRVMRSAQDDSRIGTQRPGDVSDARRRQWPDHEHVHAERGNSRHKRRFQHVARNPCVLADDDLRPGTLAGPASAHFGDHVRGGAPQF